MAVSLEIWSKVRLKFPYLFSTEKHSSFSIQLLKDSGIDFEKQRLEGISQDIFAEYFITSGLVLNSDITWVCFHGIFDFAYLLKSLTNEDLPLDETTFQDLMLLYFNTFYDVKSLCNSYENLRGSLSKLAMSLSVSLYFY